MKILRNTFFLIFIVLCSFVKAQNLVPNYSFEDTIKCPTSGYFQGYITSWGGSSPQYFSKFCNDPGVGGNPSNLWGFQHAHIGNAYAGIYTFARSDSGSVNYKQNHNVRDYLEDSLLSTLIKGHKYYVTFYISLADSVKYACNNIGAYFSDSSLNFSSRKTLTYHTPQVQNDTTNNLANKTNWMKVSGSFVAQGGEQYIIIGNFIDDAHSDTIFVNSLGSTRYDWDEAYYYIDDVIVSPDSTYADSLLTAVQSISQAKEVVEVYPNPTNGLFSIAINSEELGIKNIIEVYNIMGEKVYAQNINSETTQIDLSNKAQGLYLYRILSLNGALLSQGKLIIQ